jgi:hypothetical protein
MLYNQAGWVFEGMHRLETSSNQEQPEKGYDMK